MSLISLTFGNSRSETVSEVISPNLEVITPEDQIQAMPGIENRVEVKKACQFVGHSDVYIVGQIVSGVVSNQMKGSLAGNSFQIVELESKYGHRIAKEGMTVGITVRGIPKESLKTGHVITFTQ
ncbi:hypothetical protein KKE06_00955 [Candidatus Micrarchaeota archaeon]|nr:hypothetical protein [Candidatus Micrarchaeota archaeon]MBU1929873.1 hypothetical protein [Candidatus Micrarchaeota archaeon]